MRPSLRFRVSVDRCRTLAVLLPLTALTLNPLTAQPGVIRLPHEVPPPGPEGTLTAMAHTHCEEGSAGPFPCRDVDLFAFLPRNAVGAVGPETMADLWGWTDPQTGAEIVLLTMAGGTSFVDISQPDEPRFLGKLPTETIATSWRDVKTYRNHAFIVADGSGGHGMQIFDLTRLRSVGGSPRTFDADAIYRGPGFGKKWGIPFGPAHNLAINEETGFAYIVGSDSCLGGLHMVSIAEPLEPRFAGCYDGDGYTHDLQCVVYRGPDGAFGGSEICFAANEDTITLVDVTDKGSPTQLARVTYPNVGYTHQVWLTDDHRYLLSNDELDELQFGLPSRTLIWDVSSLSNPTLLGTYLADSPSSDHNLYIADGLVYAANYASGLRILDLDQVAQGRLEEVAFFDIVPENDTPGFVGAWSAYPFFASGTVPLSGTQQGLFLLDPFAGHHAEGAEGPPAPRNLRLQPVGPKHLVRWKDLSGGETGFRLYRAIGDEPEELVAELDAGTTRFIDDGQGPRLYTYRLTAILDGEESAPVMRTLDLRQPETPASTPAVQPWKPQGPHHPGF